SASSVPMEKIADEMGDAEKWFQLYWSRDFNITKSFLKRAESAGYSAIVVTLDTPMMAWREYDVNHGYLPFLAGEGVGNYVSEAAARAELGEEPEDNRLGVSIEWTKICGKAALPREDIEFVKEHTDLPIILKGIGHPADAKEALIYNLRGVTVSNHG